MDEYALKKSDSMHLVDPSFEEISPFDETYPVRLLSNSLLKHQNQAEHIAENLYRVLAKASPILTQTYEATKKGYRFVVDATEKTLEAIDSGKVKLTTDKTGKMYAQIRVANGQWGSKLPIKKEVFAKGIDSVQMANTIQMNALQEQLEQITEQLAIIDHSVREISQGQQNDRIALYYSGLSLYLEANNVIDVDLRKTLIAQSLRALTDATFQLVLTMQTDIKYLANGDYKLSKGKRVALIDGRIKNINQTFTVIHLATILRAGIYCQEGELPAMSAVLNEYSQFIEGTVAKNAGLLAQCDVNDTGTENGLWKSRAKLRLDVSEFRKQLSAPDKVIYLSIVKENA